MAAKKTSKPKAPKDVAPAVASATRLELLATILASPKDDRARLVYADLLQDEGDPRGELISVSSARNALPRGDERGEALLAREEALLKKHKKAWTSAFGETKGARWEFRNGFVEKLSIDADAIVRCGAGIFAAEPIEELAVWKIPASTMKTGDSPLAPVLALKGLSRVRHLSLARSLLTAVDLEALEAATTLGNVETLDLSDCLIGPDGVATLARARSMPRLRDLRLGTCDVMDDGVAALAASTSLQLVRLVLSRNEIRARGAAAIATALWAPTLTHLDLSTNSLEDAGILALASSTSLGALRSLNLEYCGGFSGDVVDAVLASPVFAGLEHVDLSSNFDRDALVRLRAAFGDRLHLRYDNPA